MVCSESRALLQEAWQPVQETMQKYRQEMLGMENDLNSALLEIDNLRESLLRQALDLQTKEALLRQQAQSQILWEQRFREQESQLTTALQSWQTATSQDTQDLSEEVTAYRQEILRLEQENRTLRQECDEVLANRAAQEQQVQAEINNLRELLDSLAQRTLSKMRPSETIANNASEAKASVSPLLAQVAWMQRDSEKRKKKTSNK
jgi:uncharacterized protein (UPF0335 family)